MVQHCCLEMTRHLEEGEVAIVYLDHLREYGIRVLDGGSSQQVIKWCPWCGKALPVSLRDKWFERVEKLGLEPNSPKLPVELQSGEWWRNKGL